MWKMGWQKLQELCPYLQVCQMLQEHLGSILKRPPVVFSGRKVKLLATLTHC